MAALTTYFTNFRDGNSTVPSGQALKKLAQTMDNVTERIVVDLTRILEESPEHQRRTQVLRDQPRTAGAFEQRKILLDDSSSFEQMVAISSWLKQIQIRDNHTFFLAAPEEEYIPVYIRKYNNIQANMMHVRLGNTTGSHKAPKYEDWTRLDPWKDPTQKIFIQPLESLEIVRQPQFSGATVFKGNAFESDYIDSEWRYGKIFACVEDKGQSKKGVPTVTAKKAQSVGLNTTSLAHEFSDAIDPLCQDVNICAPVCFEEYSDDSYNDNLDNSVSPGALIQAAETAIVKRDNTNLTRLLENLVIAKLEVPSTPMLRNYLAERISENSKGE